MKQGATRNVFLTKKYVMKIPRFVEWRLFLHGLLANMQEAKFWAAIMCHKIRLCPVWFSVPGGFLIVMARAEPLSREEFAEFDYDRFIDAGEWVVPVENKLESFGKLDGRIVAIDYGT